MASDAEILRRYSNRWGAFTDDELIELGTSLLQAWMADTHADDRLNSPLRYEIEAEQARRKV